MRSKARTRQKRAQSKGAVPELLEAVMAKSLAAVRRNVRAGADVDECEDGFTPLMAAASGGDERITAYLIARGANVNARNEIGQTPLMIAALNGHKSIVQQLIASGADLCAIDNEKRNAIAWAARRGDYPEVISILGVSGAEYNSRDTRGVTPLICAALMGFSDSVGILLTLGADATVKFRGKTAHQMAREKGHEGVCKTIEAILKNRPKNHKI